MRKTSLVVAAVLAAVATLFTTSAATAVDYSAPVLNVSNGPAGGAVAPGAEFTLAGDFGGTECNPWVANFEGQTASGSGTTYSATFTAPTQPGVYFVNFTCTYEDGASLQSSASSSILFQAEAQLSVRIVVGDAAVGAGTDTGAGQESGILPNAGGSNLLLLAAGGALLLAGLGVVAARRRQS